jgi:Big-like domain-containing protein/parallel beta helix pectate lyase-like protein
MTFMHKLSCRLARLRDRVAFAPTAALAAAVVLGCERPAAITDTGSPLTQFLVAPQVVTLQQNQTQDFTAVGLTATGDTAAIAVAWSASGGAIDTSSKGGRHYGHYRATSCGDYTVTATSNPGAMRAAASVSVLCAGAVPVDTVVLSAAAARLFVGNTVQLSATPEDSVRNPLSGRTVTWTSSNVGVASVSGGGLVTGVAAGTATITATSGGKSGSAAVTVVVVPVATVSVSPATVSVAVGSPAALSATPQDSAGHLLSGRAVSWTTSNGAVATVSASGLVTGVTVGSATITATSEGKSGTAAITVTAAPPPGSCVAVCHYVDAAAGNDANPGTSTSPWRTIQHAADVMNPGDTVIVNDGVYTGGTSVVTVSQSGTASAWLVFRAAHRWGAVIDGQNNSSTMGINISGNYVHVEGFEVRNTSRYGFEVYGGSETVAGIHDVDLVQNHIHDIGHVCTDDVGGHVGIDSYADNLTIERNVLHDVGRFGPGEQGCTPLTTNWQNHDHGIYNGVGNNVVIRNNVFYNFAHGWAIQRYSGPGAITSGLTIVNNTFAFPNPWRDGQVIIATGSTNLTIANNIFYQPTTAGVLFETGGLTNVTVSNNLTYGGTAFTGATPDVASGNLGNTDPLFMNVAGLDFRVQAGSPAIGAGLPLPSVTNDITGAARPTTGGYTIGAYEFK